MTKFYIYFSIILLSACTTTATNLRYSDLSATKSSSHTATVYIYYAETSQWRSGLNATVIYINNEKVARLDENLFTRIQVNPGDFVFTTSTDHKMACKGSLFSRNNWPPLPVNAQAGHEFYLRYSSTNYQGPSDSGSTCSGHLMQVKKETALKQMSTANYVVPVKEVY